MVVASFMLKQIYFAIPNHLILAKYSPVLERQSSHCRGAAGAGRVKLKIIHPEPASTPGTAVLEPACSGPVTPYQHVGAVQVWRTNKDKTPSTSPSPLSAMSYSEIMRNIDLVKNDDGHQEGL